MTDLHGWITQQIDRAQKEEPPHARACACLPEASSCCGTAECDCAQYDSTGPCDCGWPSRILRRCEADRRVLARHRLATEWTWAHDEPCHGCGVMGDCDDPVTDHLNDCPELLDLAHAYGLTDEILAGLDRPEMPPPPVFKPRGPVPDTRRVPPALRGPNWSSR